MLIFNQLILSSYAINNRRIDLKEYEESNFIEKYKNESKLFSSNKNSNEDNYINQEAEDIEKFIEETFDQNNIDILKNQQSVNPKINDKFDSIDEEFIINDHKNKKLRKRQKVSNQQTKNKKNKFNKKNLNQGNINESNLPFKSIISTSEFRVPPRGYVKLMGPKTSLNLKRADSIETLKLIAKLGGYGIVVIEEKNSKGESLENPKITANFENVEISDVFNSILLSANLQAVVENKIIFIGKNVLNKSLKPKVSKTYRLNQVNAASVADYLSTLGAKISKVMLISGSIDGQEIGDGLINKKDFEDEVINSYGIEKGHFTG